MGSLLTIKDRDTTETKTETRTRAAEEALVGGACCVPGPGHYRGGGYCSSYDGESDGDDGFGEHVDNWDSCRCVETKRPKFVIAGCAKLA
jgi:hypothetical protein